MPVALLKLCPPAEAAATDADLLARFAAARDEAAFAELVRRHGPVVLRVCRRLVPGHADDAFQAVFLVLACRGAAVRNPAAVGGWLVGVAGRVARQMRAAERRRAAHERETARDPVATEPPPEARELAAVLDGELARLPARLRDPLVLCLVAGRTHEQVAASLATSVRTLRRRLDRARAVLRARLERRGVVPAVAGSLVAGVWEATGAVPQALVRQTTSVVFQFLNGGAAASTAVAVAKGVMQGMVKIKASALVSTAAAVLVWLGAGVAQPEAPRPVTPPPGEAPPTSVPAAPNVAPPPAAPNVAADLPAGERPGGVYRSPNFVVYAPTPVMARVIAAEAEHHRRAVALLWLGKELPPWPSPCAVRLAPALGASGGASTFTFAAGAGGKGVLKTAAVDLRGDFMAALTTLLPHEVTHAVLATHFGAPLPRWADEGIALLSEPDAEQAAHDARVREQLDAGRGVRLKVLLPMAAYHKDLLVVYAQGHSLARFLVGRTEGVPVLADLPHVGELFKAPGADGRRRLVAFVHLGTTGNTAESWGQAAKAVYGLASADALEEAWLEWLKTPGSVLAGKGNAGGDPPAAKPGASDRIPPVRLPGTMLPPPALPAPPGR